MKEEAMISGAHVIIYSNDADADRAFFRDTLRFPAVDAGDGWLIFALPPAEVAIHPTAESDSHELYLMCDDIETAVRDLNSSNVECSAVTDEGWGLLTHVSLPGGGRLGLYQPRHAVPDRIGAA
jgi:catechol 2,3-dioxygenase-like lactoylglutathione lyase family enzyme